MAHLKKKRKGKHISTENSFHLLSITRKPQKTTSGVVTYKYKLKILVQLGRKDEHRTVINFYN